MSWKKVKLGSIITESKVISKNPDTNKRIKVRLKVLGVEKRGIENEVEGATKQYIRKAGQFIFGKQNFHKGAFGIVPKELDGFESSSDLPAFDIDKSCLSEFLFYYFKQGNYYLELSKIAYGVATQRINVKEFYELEIPLPNIEEQNLLISRLKSLENHGSEIHTELTHQLDLVKQLRQSFLREAMQGKLLAKAENTNITIPPAKAGDYLLDNNTTFSDNEINRKGFQPIPNDSNPIGFSQTGQQLLEKVKAEKAHLIADKKIKKEKPLAPITAEEIPFEIPEHWVWCRLGEIAYITSGSTPSKESFTESGIPYLKMYNLRNQKIDFFHKPQYIKEEVHNGQLKRCRAYSGDVIMNIVGPPLGKIAIIPESIPECNFNQAAVLIRPLIKSMNFFVFWYLNEMSEIKAIDTKGVAGQANISVTQSHNMKIPLPPLHEQEQIVDKLEELMGFCDGLEHSIKQSQGYNEMLLQQVLREALQPKEESYL
jgi:type I restriction enzyme S subunit